MLYILRHGKTDWNNEHKLQGRTDIPLNDEGRRMAALARSEYADVHLDVCYCSPLRRAKQTAEILLSGRDVPIITDDRLTEMCFGEYEGVKNSFEIPGCPINTLFHDPESYDARSCGAESLESLFRRTGEFLDEAVYPKLKDGRDILIVGHGAMNSAIICQIKGLPVSEFWSSGIEQCKFTRLL